jgi:hypothetical protein
VSLILALPLFVAAVDMYDPVIDAEIWVFTPAVFAAVVGFSALLYGSNDPFVL